MAADRRAWAGRAQGAARVGGKSETGKAVSGPRIKVVGMRAPKVRYRAPWSRMEPGLGLQRRVDTIAVARKHAEEQ
ncbi:hypothetical protein Atai01_48700 [Amycolatopsis taiwanensis]|uniref:Uncharacterized protein n=1 Tax=Amycolatopsis taiwanensis TaxID=342230 RepID=A0A9W6R3N6_9PSEU|nr:hypothetical protein Atai01_48700 [Amycolatopsis taiwanensis]